MICFIQEAHFHIIAKQLLIAFDEVERKPNFGL